MVSILRRAQLDYIPTIRLKGDVIDLGAKSSENSYFALLCKDDVKTFTFADYYHDGPDIVQIDFEKKFKVPDESFDTILAFNVLEHIFNYDQFISECHRIARNGASFHLLIPFLWKFHEDPFDFHRYTHQALERILDKHSWEIVSIAPTVDGQFAVTCSMFESYLPSFLRRHFQSLALFIDRLIAVKTNRKVTFPLGYNVHARKRRS